MRASCSANGVRKVVRKTLEWGGAAAAVLLTIVWIGSLRWKLTWGNAFHNRVYIEAGRVSVHRTGILEQWCKDRFDDISACLASIEATDADQWPTWAVGGVPASRAEALDECHAGLKDLQIRWRLTRSNAGWSFSHMFRTPREFEFSAPLPAFLIPAALVTGVAWHVDRRPTRRARAGRCITCGYDRRGIPSNAPCSECGNANVA